MKDVTLTVAVPRRTGDGTYTRTAPPGLPATRPVQRVQQEHAKGCALACLAMVSGIPYQAVVADFEGDRNAEGVSHHSADAWLAERGYAVQRRYRYYAPLHSVFETWPCPPFAPVHIVEVEYTNGGHSVVMLAGGTVLDPNVEGARKLADYDRVTIITGIHRVGSPLSSERLIGQHYAEGEACRYCGANVHSYCYLDPCPARATGQMTRK
jgi:hypothetical protein